MVNSWEVPEKLKQTWLEGQHGHISDNVHTVGSFVLPRPMPAAILFQTQGRGGAISTLGGEGNG
jgi:hypothetical protein